MYETAGTWGAKAATSLLTDAEEENKEELTPSSISRHSLQSIHLLRAGAGEDVDTRMTF